MIFARAGGPKKKILFGVALGLMFFGVLWQQMLGSSRYRVEVCMEYQGRSECRVARAATEEAAVRTATQNACAIISSGMTDSMACDRTPPQSVKWLSKK